MSGTQGGRAAARHAPEPANVHAAHAGVDEEINLDQLKLLKKIFDVRRGTHALLSGAGRLPLLPWPVP